MNRPLALSDDFPSRTPESVQAVRKIVSFLLLSLILVWVIHVGFYFGVPARSSQGTHYALVYSAIYLLGVSTMGYFVYHLWLKFGLFDRESTRETIDLVWARPGFLMVLSIFALMGVGLHWYDKLILNEFHGLCLAEIRDAWIAAAVARGGAISSWQSALGHILSHLSFPITFALIVAGDKLTRGHRAIFWSVAIFTALSYSVIISTRSAVLSFVFCAVLAAGAKVCLKRGEVCDKAKRLLVPLMAILFTAGVYASAIFVDRMYCDSNPEQYVQPFFSELNAVSTGKLPTTDVGRVLTMFGIYISHSSWTFETSLASPERSGYVFSTFVWHWLYRLGVIPALPPGDRPYAHGMMSLPGSAWYDFQTQGMIAVSLIHGVLIGAAAVFLTSQGFLLTLGRVMYVGVGLITLWSPLAFAPNTLSYPFIGLAFVCFFGGSWFYRRNWLKE